ncbi:MAG: hypothetical protein ACJ786_35860 [Catenulispora sp.]
MVRGFRTVAACSQLTFGLAARKPMKAPSSAGSTSLNYHGWASACCRMARTAVGRLRRELGPPEVIETVAGAGYRIVVPVDDDSL